MIITLNPVMGEPSPLSLRWPVGVDLDLPLTFQKLDGVPVDPTPLFPQLVLMPRSTLQAYSYDVQTTDAGTGTGLVEVPGYVLNDPSDFSLQLYSRASNGQPKAMLALGTLRLSGGAYASLGPLGPMTIPVVEGPQGPPGPQGPQGAQGAPGSRGSIWFTGNGDPTFAAQVGDMYLDDTNGNVWRYDGTLWVLGTFP